MMTQTRRYPSYAECVSNVLSDSPQPLSVDSLLAKIAGQRPVGKGARSAVYRAIGQIFQAVPVAPGRYGWLSHLLTGAALRHPLTADEIRRGFILLDELEHIAFYPQFFQANNPGNRTLRIELFGGPTIEAETSIERKTWSLRLGPEFTAWVNEAGGQGKDDLLIYVTDASSGEYQLRLNLHEMRDERAIRRRNVQLALHAEELVGDYRRNAGVMPTWDLVARLIARGIFSEMPPADDFHFVLHEYSMLRFRDGVGYELVGSGIEDEDVTTNRSGPDGVTQSDESMEMDLRRIAFTIAADLENFAADSAGAEYSTADDLHGYDEESTSMLDDSPFGPEESCVDYQAYLSALEEDQPNRIPLSHEDFHLLEAELEMMVHLEEEFGHLLREQQERKDYLAALLYIDPNEFLEDDWDMPGGPDTIGPFWTN